MRAGSTQDASGEPRERQRPECGEGDRGVNRNMVSRRVAAQRLGRFGNVPEAHGDRGLETLSLRCQAQGPMQPVEQASPDVAFQGLDLPADGGLADPELARGLGEAHMPRGRLEDHQRIDRRQCFTQI